MLGDVLGAGIAEEHYWIVLSIDSQPTLNAGLLAEETDFDDCQPDTHDAIQSANAGGRTGLAGRDI